VSNEYEYGFVPVAGNGYEFGYEMNVVDMGVQLYYLRIVYLLPSLEERDRREGCGMHDLILLCG
jgi:hypothetical protein